MKFFGRLKIIFDVRPILFDVQTIIGREQKSGLFISVSQNHSYFISSLASLVKKGSILPKGTSKVMMPEE